MAQLSFSDILLFVLICYGITNIICVSLIVYPLRKFVKDLSEKYNNFFLKKIYELLECPMCTGFWVGMLMSYLGYLNINYFLAACISSGSCWILHNFSEFCYWSYDGKQQ